MKEIKLFCFPYAGGTASVYTRWKKYLDKDIELIPVELSGRGKLIYEPLSDNMEDIINFVYDSIKRDLDSSEYMFFGHSMGTVIVYELMNKLLEHNHKNPLHLFLSGRYPPHIGCKHNMSALSDEEFIEKVIKNGGTPKEVFENKELMEIFLPILRADYKAIEKHVPTPLKEKWDMDITVLNGIYDSDVKLDEVELWKDYTNKNCSIHHFEGGHFFINDKFMEITDIINKVISTNDDCLVSISKEF